MQGSKKAVLSCIYKLHSGFLAAFWKEWWYRLCVSRLSIIQNIEDGPKKCTGFFFFVCFNRCPASIQQMVTRNRCRCFFFAMIPSVKLVISGHISPQTITSNCLRVNLWKQLQKCLFYEEKTWCRCWSSHSGLLKIISDHACGSLALWLYRRLKGVFQHFFAVMTNYWACAPMRILHVLSNSDVNSKDPLSCQVSRDEGR